MRKIIDDNRLIYKCCSLYYEDNMNQQEISDFLGISRPSVSRMIQLGKERGIVKTKVEVINPEQFSYGNTEKALQKRYGLKEIVVVEASSLDSNLDVISKLNETAVNFLAKFFQEGDYIGISMGYTLHNICRANTNIQKKKNLAFVPILGGFSQSETTKGSIQSNQIAQEFSELFGGNYAQFLSPAVFSNPDIMKQFLNEATVNFIFEDFKKLNTIVMGIGLPGHGGSSTLVSSGYASKDEVKRFVEDGAVGDISLMFFDKDGNTNQFSDFNDRVASMPLEQMKKVENRIAIVSGADKANAVKGAIKGGFINILITDIDCAEKLI